MNKSQKKMTIASSLMCATLLNFSSVSDALADIPYIAEIRQFPYTFCPRGWADTNGQLLPVSQNTALFSLIGTTYGGDGRTTFGLPNIQGKVAKHNGNGPGLGDVRLGQSGGVESFILPSTPSHTHGASNNTTLHVSSTEGNNQLPTNAHFADGGRDRVYNTETPDTTLNSASATSTTSLASAGSDAPMAVSRRQPYLTIRYCIALTGTYPSRD
ncbi:tail fiber protein [Aliiglaciecola sp. LCG003]|uniref:phage tail protein n=1 Tax=Aliiglaciecola sp. LCG003 TaxID=3053655 RepID=UPI002572CFDF|nr:tail fiber protein [Aliiglaciecola sp. LCG003]WJG10300.1 tail fiber protein [Aliiglaciecola sp. LCG003]